VLYKFISVARRSKWLLRLTGVGLLGVLVWQLDLSTTGDTLRNAHVGMVILAVAMTIPMVLLKTLRWRNFVRCQGANYGLTPAFLAYFGGIFVGLLTPGRLGEFVRALYVQRDCQLPSGKAFSSVLVDRLFDFYALLVMGGIGLWLLLRGSPLGTWLGLFGLLLALTVPLLLLVGPTVFYAASHFVSRLTVLGTWREGVIGWLGTFRQGLRAISLRHLLMGVALTLAAYAIFFSQSYILARSVGLPVNFAEVSYAVALGSLVALLPLSISGIGTREAAVVAFMGTMGVEAGAALAFSALFFVTFYIAGGLMGAMAWWIRPLPISLWRGSVAGRAKMAYGGLDTHSSP